MSFSVPNSGSTSFPVSIVSRLRTWYDKQLYPLSRPQPISSGWHQTTCTCILMPRLSMPSTKLSMPSWTTGNERGQTFSLHCLIVISQYGNEHILQKASSEEF